MDQAINPYTGEVVPGELDQVIVHTGKRPDGTTYYELDFTYCTSRTEQHHARETDINYLVAKYKPDELAMYLSARNQHRQPLFHDFSMEPDRQQALNIRARLNSHFQNLPEEVRNHFGSPLEFLKFIDNPQNAEALIKLGLVKQKDIAPFTNDKPNDDKKTSDEPKKEATP